MERRRVTAGRDPAGLATLVMAARDGERAAWDELVDRLARLVWSITRAYGLAPHDGEDVAQIAWMRLAEHIDRLADPGAVKTWLATTTRRECITLLRRRARVETVGDEVLAERLTSPGADEPVFARERDRAVWTAFGQLSERCRRLLRVVVADRQADYATLAGTLGMPIGSIGPTRMRCLEQLRVLMAGAGITASSDPSV